MLKLLVAISLLLALCTAGAPPCSASKGLRDLYQFDSLATATTYDNTKYCKSLKNVPICCSDTTVNSIQKKADALATKLTSIVATRDRFLVKIRNHVIPKIKKSMSNFIVQADLFFANYSPR